MAEETVTRALHDGVALLTLHRPQAKNAFNAAQWDALRTALDETRENEAVAAVVVTGAGSAFSAGQDLKELGGLDGGSGAAFPRFMQALVRFDSNRPVRPGRRRFWCAARAGKQCRYFA